MLVSSASAATMARLEHVLKTVRVSEYQHKTEVDEAHGVYRLDCSGLVDWVMKRSAPRAFATVMSRTSHKRPLAEDYALAISQPGAPGWRGLAQVSQLQPGDIIAWLKPAEVDSNNTGHVMFVVGMPVAAGVDRYLVRVADASASEHSEDSRHAGGVGSGIIALLTEHGAPVAYGWKGAESKRFYRTRIALARPQD